MLREAKAEIIRLRDAKRRAMQIADERAKRGGRPADAARQELRGRRIDDFAAAPKVYGSLTAQRAPRPTGTNSGMYCFSSG
jgi:hypothetical protein